MENTEQKRAVDRARIGVVLFCIVLVLLIGVFVLVSLLKEEEILAKDEILARLETVSGDSAEGRDVVSLLEDFGISAFNQYKFKSIADRYEKYYYKEDIPSDFELAKNTALAFVNSFYDSLNLEDEDSVTVALIRCYIDAVGDNYGIYRTAEEYENYNTDMSGNFVGIGVSVEYKYDSGEMRIVEVLEGSGAEASGIMAGDYICAVDGVSVTELGYDGATNAIRGEAGTSVVITVLRGAERLDITVVRSQITEKVVKYSIDENKIGYIKITRFKGNTAKQFKEALEVMENQGAVGLVFDLRDNPGGLLYSVVDVIEMLVPEGNRIASYKQRGAAEVVYTSDNQDSIDVPCVVICNGGTASAGELFTAAVRDYAAQGIIDAKIVGEKTYGKGVAQNSFSFVDGSALTMTVAYYNPPSNVNYDGEGIRPDVPAEKGDTGDTFLDTAKQTLKQLIDN